MKQNSPKGQKTGSRARGRPRAFDRDAALEAAMHAFWRRGFDNTSMLDLVNAMGIASPSIYAAFGSKETLFREALELYVRNYGTIIRDALREEREVRSALRRAFGGVIDLLDSFDGPRGCLVVLGVGQLSEDHVMRTLVRDARQHLREELRARFDRASREETPMTDAEIEVAVEATMAFYNGLSIELLDGVEPKVLLRSVDLFVERLLFL